MSKHIHTRFSNREQTVSPLKMTSTSSQTCFFLISDFPENTGTAKKCQNLPPKCATWIQRHLWNLAYKLFFLGLGLPLLTFWRKMLKGAILLRLAIHTNSSNTHLRTNLVFSIKFEKNTKLQPVPEELLPFIPILLIINSLHEGALNCGSQMLPQ